ncbi:MAG TPA: adenylate/guanylate cyclase domain-containing protein [Thermoleophilaceae bacterium]|nr:adenylate/guanylate cyclase domain-containing protein [Thermoleophilaceae bacterium]
MAAPLVTPMLDRLVNHSWLVGDPTTPGRKLGQRVRWLTASAIVLANGVGAAVVICFALFVLPKPDGVDDPEVHWSNLGLALAYLTVAMAIGVRWGLRLVEGGRDGIRGWLEEDRQPTPAEQLRVLRAPLRVVAVEAVLWGAAVVCFTALNSVFSVLLALGVGLTVALGGLTTSSVAYLLTELALRPVASRALATGAPDRRGVPGVTARWLLAWALGTGAPIVGLALVGIVALTSVEIDESTLAVTAVTLSGIALVFGAIASLLAAYATVHPIGSIRRGLAKVQQGDFDVRLGVWDSTEIGLLQAGFNEMVGGLRERERIRDLFGRQVGREVAQQALAAAEVDLGGVECEVAVLFVDVVGSTQLAATRPPREVVNLLNRFFGEVVEAVEHNGGWINKFEGDAALAIFGAPGRLDDAEGRALRAAREIDARLRERVAELAAGIGVASGTAVAGHIGAEQRFEYTVIGDPVNEAARLSELAKARPSRVLASSATIDRANGDESSRWQLGEPIELRGRGVPTVVASPR